MEGTGERGLLMEGVLLQKIYGTLLSQKIHMAKNNMTFSKSDSLKFFGVLVIMVTAINIFRWNLVDWYFNLVALLYQHFILFIFYLFFL